MSMPEADGRRFTTGVGAESAQVVAVRAALPLLLGNASVLSRLLLVRPPECVRPWREDRRMQAS